MGSCASVNKEKDTTIGYKKGLFTKAKGFFVSSPVKQKEVFNGEKDPKLVGGFDSLPKRDSNFSDKNSNFGSQDETFFDSKAYLDSDAEDDFLSVNGDFTPSRGSTPTHPKFTPKITDLPLNRNSPDTISEPSPRKKLSQLFQETERPSKESIENETTKDEGLTENETTKNEELIKKEPTKNEELIKKEPTDDFAANERVTPVRERKKRERVMSYVRPCCLPGLNGNSTAVQAAQ